MAKAKPKPFQNTNIPVEEHKYRYIHVVTDGLNLELSTLVKTERGNHYVFKYTDRMNPAGFESTRFGTSLPMYESDLEEALRKGIFKVVKQDNA